MPLYQILILSFIQGLTEFLPISSSGHLIIIPQFLGWPDQGLAMDVAVHVGTLMAVVAYFWRDIIKMVKGSLSLLHGQVDEGGRLSIGLVVATLPAVAAGAALAYIDPPFIRTPFFIGWTTLIFGVVLWFVDRLQPQVHTVADLTPFKSFLIGCAQALALMPGTSRSGICMTMGRWLGLTRTEAARFAFLLSIPTITGAGVHTGVKLYLRGVSFLNETTLVAMAASCVFGLLAIHFMITWLRKSTFTPFVVYRIALGIFLIFLGA